MLIWYKFSAALENLPSPHLCHFSHEILGLAKNKMKIKRQLQDIRQPMVVIFSCNLQQILQVQCFQEVPWLLYSIVTVFTWVFFILWDKFFLGSADNIPSPQSSVSPYDAQRMSVDTQGRSLYLANLVFLSFASVPHLSLLSLSDVQMWCIELLVCSGVYLRPW